MSEIIFILALILWYGFSLYISEIPGRNSKIGNEYLFFIAMVFSPLVAFILITMTKNQVAKNMSNKSS